MNSPEQIPPRRDARKAVAQRRRPTPVENIGNRTPAWLEFFVSDPRVIFALCGLALWMLVNLALWIAASITWPAFYLVSALDHITGAANLPIAPFLIWTVWGGVFGGLLGDWLLAPVYGNRENRSLPLLLAFLAMTFIGVVTWVLRR